MTDTQTSEWIEHDGKGMPVDGDTEVEVRFPDGFVASAVSASYWHGRTDEASSWVVPRWGNRGARISAYRVVKP